MRYNVVQPSELIEKLALVSERRQAWLSKYTVEDYADKGAVCYLADDGLSGYALTRDHDMISVFALPGGRGAHAIQDAIDRGALTCDCIGEFLASLYKGFGFVEVERLAWDDQYAPDGWNYELDGRPDVVCLRIAGK